MLGDTIRISPPGGEGHVLIDGGGGGGGIGGGPLIVWRVLVCTVCALLFIAAHALLFLVLVALLGVREWGLWSVLLVLAVALGVLLSLVRTFTAVVRRTAQQWSRLHADEANLEAATDGHWWSGGPTLVEEAFASALGGLLLPVVQRWRRRQQGQQQERWRQWWAHAQAEGVAPTHVLTHLRLGMLGRDFTADDYEMLLQLDEMDSGGTHRPGRHTVEIADLRRLPLFRIPAIPTTTTAAANVDTVGEEGEVVEKTRQQQQLQQQQHDDDDDVEEAEDVLTSGLVIPECGEKLGRKLLSHQCAICLSLYRGGDILCTLPHCLHRFHSRCVFRWLQMDDRCPVCQQGVAVDHAVDRWLCD